MPNIYGYARASDHRRQVLSPERQESQITERAKQIEEETGAKFARVRTDRASGSKVRYDKRLEFRKLMRELQPGDHLVIWRLDRLDRGNVGMLECLEWLVKREVNIHVLEHGKMRLDLDTATGKLMVSMMAGFAAFEADRLGESTRAGIRYCKENGLACCGAPGFGRKFLQTPYQPKGRKKPRKMVVWCEKECRQIRELYERSQTGRETIRAIAMDFYARDERRAGWKPWVWKAKKKKFGRKDYLNTRDIYRAITWYKKLRAVGLDLGCDVTDPRIPRMDSVK